MNLSLEDIGEAVAIAIMSDIISGYEGDVIEEYVFQNYAHGLYDLFDDHHDDKDLTAICDLTRSYLVKMSEYRPQPSLNQDSLFEVE